MYKFDFYSWIDRINKKTIIMSTGLQFEEILADMEDRKLKNPIITTIPVISDEEKNLIEDLKAKSNHDDFYGEDVLWEK